MKGIDFKAIVIEASAGTGKTSRITREFLSMLDKDDPASSIKKILAVTFSDKAAIEMKMRILDKIFATIHPNLSAEKKIEIENAMLKLRISTIHSFCRLLLKRFAFYTGMDPFFTIIDEKQSALLYYRAFSIFLNGSGSAEILPLLKDFKLNAIKERIFAVEKCHPYATTGAPKGDFSVKISKLSGDISDIHFQLKKELSMLDFNDLEIIAREMLAEHPEALAILEDFDEKNDYIFVDEFQDTNILQWNIIYQLLEEWISGYGAKAEKGDSYGIFLVGDKKQSIYKFRGAEGMVFDDAKELFKDYCVEEKLLKNYRSAPIIIDFVNSLFEDTSPWREERLSSGIERELPSKIEITLKDAKENLDAKEEEYKWIIGRILELLERKENIWDKMTNSFRPIELRDIAILMRTKVGKRFLLLEKELKNSKIPFVILGGVGFYREDEVIFLLSLILVLADPTDGISLWNLFNSAYHITFESICKWRKELSKEALTVTVENILGEIDFWSKLSTQQRANTEKFLTLLQGWEGLPLYSVSRNLRTLSVSYDEPKADIFSEHQDAVRVLTVHNAKGLEFPVVFLVNAEDGRVSFRGDIFYEKSMERDGLPYKFTFKEEADKEFKEKFGQLLGEEEERILYVALTRACQYLFITGVKNGRGADKSLWLKRIIKLEDSFPASPLYERRELVSREEESEQRRFEIEQRDVTRLTSYTQEKEREYYPYERTIAGEIAHKLLCDISEGRIKLEIKAYTKRVKFYLDKTVFYNSGQTKKTLMSIYKTIEKNTELRSIIEAQESGRTFSELPFITEIERGKIYTGVIDRIILNRDNSCSIYDYKLYGSDTGFHSEQMKIYEKAVRNIFPTLSQVKKYIVFLSSGAVKEITEKSFGCGQDN